MECRTHGLQTRRSAVAVKTCAAARACVLCVRCSEQRLYSTWRRQRGALQLLWFRCKPLGYCQAELDMRLNQLHDRMPPLQAPILTNMVVPASVASVASALMCYGSKINRSTSSSRLICAVPFACDALAPPAGTS